VTICPTDGPGKELRHDDPGFSRSILLASTLLLIGTGSGAADQAVPLAIGETFTIDSRILGETRRINV